VPVPIGNPMKPTWQQHSNASHTTPPGRSDNGDRLAPPHRPTSAARSSPANGSGRRELSLPLRQPYLNWIRDGRKTVEGRINSGIPARLREGDHLWFTGGRGGTERLRVRVTKLQAFTRYGQKQPIELSLASLAHHDASLRRCIVVRCANRRQKCNCELCMLYAFCGYDGVDEIPPCIGTATSISPSSQCKPSNVHSCRLLTRSRPLLPLRFYCDRIYLHCTCSFEDMLTATGVAACLPDYNDVAKAVRLYRSFPGYREKEQKFGTLAIHMAVEPLVYN